jgi:hypothetical protein
MVYAGGAIQETVRCCIQTVNTVQTRPETSNSPGHIKDLNPEIFAIGDIEESVVAPRDCMWRMELARGCATRSPFKDLFSENIEFYDPRIAIAIGDEEIPRGQNADLGRLVEAPVVTAALAIRA